MAKRTTKPSKRNVELLSEVKEKVDRAQAMFFVDYQGLTHQQLEEARRELRKNDSEAAIVKNTLMSIALSEKGIDAKEKLQGAHATLFSYVDPVKTAKVLAAFYKKYLPAGRQVSDVIKFGVYNGQIIDEATITKLATIPSREVLIGKLVGSLKSPLYGLHRALSWNITKFVLTLKEIEKKKAQAS